MIDLHLHCLPTVDDGPAELEEAVTMCRLAASEGCDVLVATPHQRHPRWRNTDPGSIRALAKILQAAVGKHPTIRVGAEVRVDADLLLELQRHPASGILPLAESRYILIEFARGGIGLDPGWVVQELVADGWRPVIAHPEFIPRLVERPERVARLVQEGALVQVTADSLLGRFGRKAERCVRRLLRQGLVHFVASDAHDLERRPPGLQTAYDRVASRWGTELAEEIFVLNPQAVLADRPMAVAR